jgi:hypothetical protein
MSLDTDTFLWLLLWLVLGALAFTGLCYVLRVFWRSCGWWVWTPKEKKPILQPNVLLDRPEHDPVPKPGTDRKKP